MNKALELLTAAQNLIRDPARWIKGEIAKDAAGNNTNSTNANACQWCSLGAISKIADNLDLDVKTEVRQYLREVTGTNIVMFNDDPDTTHEQLMAVFDKARELASQ